MTIKKTGVIFECEHAKDNCVKWNEICSEDAPFRSVSEEETIKHEKEHFKSIVDYKKILLYKRYAIQILTKELLVGKWTDWEKIYELGKQFSFIIHRQKLMHGQSIITWQNAMSLEFYLKKLVWEQTKDGKIIKRHGTRMQLSPRCSKLFKIIEASWSTNEKNGKDGFEHLIEMETLIQEISREMQIIKEKFTLISLSRKTSDDIEHYIAQTKSYINGDREFLSSKTT